MKQLKIVAKTDGFRRCGIAHTSDPKFYPLDKFTTEELARLKAEPELIVSEVEIEERNTDDASQNANADPEQTPEANLAKVVEAIKDLTEKGAKVNVTELSRVCGFKVSGELKEEALKLIETTVPTTGEE